MTKSTIHVPSPARLAEHYNAATESKVTTRDFPHRIRAGMARRQSTHPVRPAGLVGRRLQPLLRTVANSYFRGQPGLVVLGIDEELLEAEVRWEPPSAPMEGVSPMDRFPHVYGPINTDAVTDVADLVEGDGGEWICRLL